MLCACCVRCGSGQPTAEATRNRSGDAAPVLPTAVQCLLHWTSDGLALHIEASVRAIADARPCLSQRASQDAFCSPASVSSCMLTNLLHVGCRMEARSRRTSASAVFEE